MNSEEKYAVIQNFRKWKYFVHSDKEIACSSSFKANSRHTHIRRTLFKRKQNDTLIHWLAHLSGHADRESLIKTPY